MRISDWSSDVCSSDLVKVGKAHPAQPNMMKYAGTELNKRRHELMMAAGGSRAPEQDIARLPPPAIITPLLGHTTQLTTLIHITIAVVSLTKNNLSQSNRSIPSAVST